MITLPNWLPEPPLDPPEEKYLYEDIDDVPDSVIDDWIDTHRETIVEHFSDEILEYAEESYEPDDGFDEEDDD